MWRRAILCLTSLVFLGATAAAPGQVQFVYGTAAPPIMQCSPIHACVLMLQAGEHILDAISGDTARWIMIRGVASGNVPTIYFKPVDAGIPSTNVVITTTRRTYEVILQAVPLSEHEVYGFTYPAPAGADHAASPATLLGESTPASATTGIIAPNRFDFSYRTTGPAWLAPVITCNDGRHTWFELPGSVHGAPSIFMRDGNGQAEVVTAHRDGAWYRIDAVPDAIVIVAGALHNYARVVVTRE